jgi:hypothetical protein
MSENIIFKCEVIIEACLKSYKVRPHIEKLAKQLPKRVTSSISEICCLPGRQIRKTTDLNIGYPHVHTYTHTNTNRHNKHIQLVTKKKIVVV